MTILPFALFFPDGRFQKELGMKKIITFNHFIIRLSEKRNCWIISADL